MNFDCIRTDKQCIRDFFITGTSRYQTNNLNFSITQLIFFDHLIIISQVLIQFLIGEGFNPNVINNYINHPNLSDKLHIFSLTP